MNRPITFFFQPYRDTEGLHVVEKSEESGKKKRHLLGIASGSKLDGHGERLTENCIKSMQEQGNTGDILLYADLHGVRSTEDIGRLWESKILPNGDWFVDFALYDETDGVGRNTLETSDKLWKQINGLPPYKNKRQKGFSIEGFIPDSGIVEMSDDGRRVIDQVILDGCVCVPRPAYESSITYSVYKALGEPYGFALTQVKKGLETALREKIDKEEKQQTYYSRKWKLFDALESEIEKIMSRPGEEKRGLLEAVLDEFKGLFTNLLLESQNAFIESNTASVDEVIDLYAAKESGKVQIYKSMLARLDNAEKILIGENYNG